MLFFSMSVYAAKKALPLSSDSRIKEVMYDPNQVYEIVGNPFVQTLIEFESGERLVRPPALGNSIAWQPELSQHGLLLKLTEVDHPPTNLTVFTNKRTYLFHLTPSRDSQQATFLLRFKYPLDEMNEIATTAFVDHPFSVDQSASKGVTNEVTNPYQVAINPQSLNFHYEAAGEIKALGLIRAFDDGQFTFFEIDKNKMIPTIFVVMSDGTEALVSVRREGRYMVVERTAGKFTVRDGEMLACVVNRQYDQLASSNLTNSLSNSAQTWLGYKHD